VRPNFILSRLNCCLRARSLSSGVLLASASNTLLSLHALVLVLDSNIITRVVTDMPHSRLQSMHSAIDVVTWLSCGQMSRWTQVPHDTEVILPQCHTVLDGGCEVPQQWQFCTACEFLHRCQVAENEVLCTTTLHYIQALSVKSRTLWNARIYLCYVKISQNFIHQLTQQQLRKQHNNNTAMSNAHFTSLVV